MSSQECGRVAGVTLGRILSSIHPDVLEGVSCVSIVIKSAWV